MAETEERSEMPGRYGFAKYGKAGSPPDPADRRVTNAERFRPLQPAMPEIVGRLEHDFVVERSEGYGLDAELDRGLGPASPIVRGAATLRSLA